MNSTNHEAPRYAVFSTLHDKINEVEMGGTFSTNGEKRNACRLLVRMPEGKRPLGKPRCKWINNIKMELREIILLRTLFSNTLSLWF
jgi:hypothetical protein